MSLLSLAFIRGNDNGKCAQLYLNLKVVTEYCMKKKQKVENRNQDSTLGEIHCKNHVLHTLIRMIVILCSKRKKEFFIFVFILLTMTELVVDFILVFCVFLFFSIFERFK